MNPYIQLQVSSPLPAHSQPEDSVRPGGVVQLLRARSWKGHGSGLQGSFSF